MRFPSPPPSLSVSVLVSELGFDFHAGQPLVLAFSPGVGLRESPVLRRIRAELRGLGAALLWCAREQAFVFHPDDALDLNGSSRSISPPVQRELRVACRLGRCSSF